MLADAAAVQPYSHRDAGSQSNGYVGVVWQLHLVLVLRRVRLSQFRSCSAYSAKSLNEMGHLVSMHQGEQLIREQYAAECPCSRSLTWYVVGRMGVDLLGIFAMIEKPKWEKRLAEGI